MKELTDAVNSAVDGGVVSEECLLDNAAIKWAGHSLSAYRDGLLKKALAISEAISNFTSEIQAPER